MDGIDTALYLSQQQTNRPNVGRALCQDKVNRKGIMPRYRTNRHFARLSDLDLSGFTGGVIDGLEANPKLPDPPEPTASLEAKKDAFDDGIIAASGGGKMQTALKDADREILLVALNKDASYVDINCGDDLAGLLSSNYDPVDMNRTQELLEPPLILAAFNGPQPARSSCA
jgi:hypothetical protein